LKKSLRSALYGGGRSSLSEVFDQRGDEEALVAKALVTLMAVHREKLVPKA